MSISDIIEQYLKKIVHSNEEKVAEIKRSELADLFQCVPSQINYVINTRFTIEKGYIIESKRGGGGYIRISRIEHREEIDLINDIITMINPKVSQQGARDVMERLYEKKVITLRELKLILSTIDRNVLAVSLPERDRLRARILTDILTTLKRGDRSEERRV